MHRRFALAALAAAATLVLATGCSPGEPAPTTGDSLSIGIPETVSTLDSDAVTASRAGREILSLIADPLFTFGADGTVSTNLVDTFEWNDDQLQLTLSLVPEVVFSNGDPLTAADVKFSLENAKNGPLAGSTYANIETVTAVDDATVRIDYATASSAALLDLTSFNASIIPADFAGTTAEEFWLDPVGTGPYEVKDWDQGVSITLTANESYRGDAPKSDELAFFFTADPNTRLLQLQNGTVDIATDINTSQVDSVVQDTNLELAEFSSAMSNFLTINTTRPPLDDEHARRALSLAVDRDLIVSSVLKGTGEPVAGFLVPSVLGGHTPAFGVEFDQEQARAELSQSAYPDGFSFEIVYIAGGDLSEALQVTQASLKEVGIDAQLTALAPEALRARTDTADFGALSANIIPDNDAGSILQYYGATGGFGSQDPSLIEEVELAVAQANADFTEEGRLQIFQGIADTIAESGTAVGLYTPKRLYATSSRVAGLTAINTAGTLDYAAIQLVD